MSAANPYNHAIHSLLTLLSTNPPLRPLSPIPTPKDTDHINPSSSSSSTTTTDTPLPLLPTSFLQHHWHHTRDTLIGLFACRTTCSHCQQAPPILPLRLTQQLSSNHRLSRSAEQKWAQLLRAMDVELEVLTQNMLLDFVDRLWEVEGMFLEGNVGGKGCGAVSWCGFFEGVEIV